MPQNIHLPKDFLKTLFSGILKKISEVQSHYGFRDKTCKKVPVLGIEPSTFGFCHFLVIFSPSELPCLGFSYIGFSSNKIISSKLVFILHLPQFFSKTLVFGVLKKLFESRLVLQVFNQKWEQNVTRTQKSVPKVSIPSCQFRSAHPHFGGWIWAYF